MECCIGNSTLSCNENYAITPACSVILFFRNSALDSHNLLRNIRRGRTQRNKGQNKEQCFKSR